MGCTLQGNLIPRKFGAIQYRIWEYKIIPFLKTILFTVDEDLPDMPPLTVVLPPTYPALSPICDLRHYQESSSPFIKEVANLLSARLSKKTSVYSLVTFLDNYEMSLLRGISKELEDD